MPNETPKVYTPQRTATRQRKRQRQVKQRQPSLSRAPRKPSAADKRRSRHRTLLALYCLLGLELLAAALPNGVVHTGHRAIGFEQSARFGLLMAFEIAGHLYREARREWLLSASELLFPTLS